MKSLFGLLALSLLLGGCAQVRYGIPNANRSNTDSSDNNNDSNLPSIIAAARVVPRAPLAETFEYPAPVQVNIAGIGE